MKPQREQVARSIPGKPLQQRRQQEATRPEIGSSSSQTMHDEGRTILVVSRPILERSRRKLLIVVTAPV
jgi:hypothetical protein